MSEENVGLMRSLYTEIDAIGTIPPAFPPM